MTRIQIQPVSIFPDTVSYLELTSANVRSFGENGSAVVTWQLQDASGNSLKNGLEHLTGSDYQGWNDDLPYLTNWLLSRLGLVAV